MLLGIGLFQPFPLRNLGLRQRRLRFRVDYDKLRVDNSFPRRQKFTYISIPPRLRFRGRPGKVFRIDFVSPSTSFRLALRSLRVRVRLRFWKDKLRFRVRDLNVLFVLRRFRNNIYALTSLWTRFEHSFYASTSFPRRRRFFDRIRNSPSTWFPRPLIYDAVMTNRFCVDYRFLRTEKSHCPHRASNLIFDIVYASASFPRRRSLM